MPWSVRKDALWLSVRLTPKARKVGVLGLQTDANGDVAVKAAVSAPPENGKANAALVDLLAKTWGFPKRDLSIVQGETDRRKVVAIAGDPDTLTARLAPLVEALPRG
ncbi:DUF167 family protein [Phaeovibrio sulfidiphilus]|uniref:DUF167 family protein n=1 Tax=Phaeovibrio sulfidiphilus TaxID=1220600 RepID=UPI00308409DE